MLNWIINTVNSAIQTTQTIVQQVGVLWSDVVNYVSNAINTAIKSVQGWLTDLYNTVQSWALAIFATMSDVYRYVGERGRTIVEWAVKQASAFAEQLINGVRDWVATNFPFANQVIKWIEDRIAQVRGFVQTWIQPLIDALRGDFSGLQKLVGQIMADIMDGDIGKLVKGLLPILESILFFFKDPLRAIRDLILPLLITWVCNALAHEIDPSIPLYGALSGPGGGTGGGEIGGSSPGQTGELAWPLDGLRISGNTFGVPPGHVGIDLYLPKGKKVYAMHGGVAAVPNPMPSGYGNYVIVSGGKWRTLYAHGQQVIIGNGAKVDRGQQIMVGDSVGRSTGDHLHLEIIYNGQYIDPVDVLPIER